MEKNINTTVYFCFLFFKNFNMIWSNSILEYYRSNNCIYMYFGMYYVLDFTFDFYSCCYIDFVCFKIC